MPQNPITDADATAAHRYADNLPESVLGKRSIAELAQVLADHRVAERERIRKLIDSIITKAMPPCK